MEIKNFKARLDLQMKIRKLEEEIANNLSTNVYDTDKKQFREDTERLNELKDMLTEMKLTITVNN